MSCKRTISLTILITACIRATNYDNSKSGTSRQAQTSPETSVGSARQAQITPETRNINGPHFQRPMNTTTSATVGNYGNLCDIYVYQIKLM